MSDNNVKVRIQCSTRIRYDQVVTMTQAEWEKLKRTPLRKMESECGSPLPGLLDMHDVCGSSDFDDVELMTVSDNDGTPCDPPDEWEED